MELLLEGEKMSIDTVSGKHLVQWRYWECGRQTSYIFRFRGKGFVIKKNFTIVKITICA